MTVDQVQGEIIDEFSIFDDWMQRYEYMIELGKSLPLIETNIKLMKISSKAVKARFGFTQIWLMKKWCLPPTVMP